MYNDLPHLKPICVPLIPTELTISSRPMHCQSPLQRTGFILTTSCKQVSYKLEHKTSTSVDIDAFDTYTAYCDLDL